MKIIKDFVDNDSASGILLILVTVLALRLSNSVFSDIYQAFLHIPVEIRFGSLSIDKSLYHWVNDGLMAIFFLTDWSRGQKRNTRGTLIIRQSNCAAWIRCTGRNVSSRCRLFIF